MIKDDIFKSNPIFCEVYSGTTYSLRPYIYRTYKDGKMLLKLFFHVQGHDIIFKLKHIEVFHCHVYNTAYAKKYTKHIYENKRCTDTF